MELHPVQERQRSTDKKALLLHPKGSSKQPEHKHNKRRVFS
jgi:hypothetical protein